VKWDVHLCVGSSLHSVCVAVCSWWRSQPEKITVSDLKIVCHVSVAGRKSLYLSTNKSCSIAYRHTKYFPVEMCRACLTAFQQFVPKVSNSFIGEMTCNVQLDFQLFPEPVIWRVNWCLAKSFRLSTTEGLHVDLPQLRGW